MNAVLVLPRVRGAGRRAGRRAWTVRKVADGRIPTQLLLVASVARQSRLIGRKLGLKTIWKSIEVVEGQAVGRLGPRKKAVVNLSCSMYLTAVSSNNRLCAVPSPRVSHISAPIMRRRNEGVGIRRLEARRLILARRSRVVSRSLRLTARDSLGTGNGRAIRGAEVWEVRGLGEIRALLGWARFAG